MNDPGMFKFRLYVANDLETSAQALKNLNAICREHLPGQYEIEVVNVYQEAKRTLADGILMTPTLLKLAPGPLHKIVGTLARKELVLELLGINKQREVEFA